MSHERVSTQTMNPGTNGGVWIVVFGLLGVVAASAIVFVLKALPGKLEKLEAEPTMQNQSSETKPAPRTRPIADTNEEVKENVEIPSEKFWRLVRKRRVSNGLR